MAYTIIDQDDAERLVMSENDSTQTAQPVVALKLRPAVVTLSLFHPASTCAQPKVCRITCLAADVTSR
jgi:hypothetical protein